MSNRAGVGMGEGLLGLSRPVNRPPNTFSLGRYLFVLTVVVLGCIYAAPNLYPPDPAIQIRATSDENPVTQATLDRANDVLTAEGITARGETLTTGGALIRLSDDETQLRAKDRLSEVLNATGNNYVVALNRAPTTPDWLVSLGARPMALGLDLSGGVHFLLQVDMAKAVSERLENTEAAIKQQLRDGRLRYARGRWQQDEQLVIPFQDPDVRDTALPLLEESFQDFTFLARPAGDQPALIVTMKPDAMAAFEEYAIDQNLTSLRNRVNELGVSEPLVQRFGRNRIVVDLPGIQDSARAKEIINKFANLEFRLVDVTNARPSQTERYEYEGRRYNLDIRNIVTGDSVTNAQQGFDPETQQPQVNITLDGDGGRRMNEVTRVNVGNPMAIVFKESIPGSRTKLVDGEEVQEYFTTEKERLINVATIQSALGVRFRITGLGLNEARDLALLLRAGALAAPMYIVEERTVGASLGEENIEKGQLSVMIGLAMVLVFMLFYYKLFGLAANLALSANLILLVAIMSVLGATLTLPGIAGIVLTVGMAVDANVLIFSRIREELKERTPQLAIQAGFDRAFLTILDANITTFFVAVILLSIGSGPIKGFAVTLAVGIVTSMFTAILGTRSLVNLMYGGRKLEKITI